MAVPYFVARPAADGDRPTEGAIDGAAANGAGVIVVLEGNGLSLQLLRVCERLAAQGYVALAPDLYARFGPPDPEATMAEGWFGKLRDEDALADLTEAAAELRERFGVSRVGITGFCNGGRLSYRAATSGVPVDAAVGFYGGRIAQQLGTPACPTLLFFGDRDEYVPMTDVAAVEAAHPGEVVIYQGAQHGFFRDGSPSYDEDAAHDAWSRLLDFFGRHLA
jgi:carboxymethylenebutenolidase